MRNPAAMRVRFVKASSSAITMDLVPQSKAGPPIERYELQWKEEQKQGAEPARTQQQHAAAGQQRRPVTHSKPVADTFIRPATQHPRSCVCAHSRSRRV